MRFQRLAFVLALLAFAGVAKTPAAPVFPNPQIGSTEIGRSANADFNRDGRLDIAAISVTSPSDPRGSIAVYLGQADGTFSNPILLGTSGRALVVGDFNGDTIPDIVAQGTLSDRVLFFRGDGAGGFSAGVATFSNVTDIAAGDLNGDGRTDLMVVDAQGMRPFFGQTNGTFSIQPYVFNGPAVRVGLGDFNGDHVPDPVYVSGTVSSGLTIGMFRNLGNGQYASMWQFFAQGTIQGTLEVTTGDLDGDGFGDVAVLSEIFIPGSDTFPILVYFSNGTISFTAGSPIDGLKGWLSIGDLDGDGRGDLVNSGGRLRVLTHSSARGFTAQADQLLACSDHSLGDFDADGRLDIVAGRVENAVFHGRGDGTFDIPRFPTGSRPRGLAIGDLNEDGHPDVVAAEEDPGNIAVLPGLGDGRLGQPALYPYPPSTALPRSVAVCDFDGDGHLDVAATFAGNGAGAHLLVFFGVGDGTLLPVVDTVLQETYTDRIQCADLNRDGIDDLVMASSDVSVFLGRTDRVVGPEHLSPLSPTALNFAIADLDEDGTLDFVGADTGGIAMCAGHGDGTFGPSVTIATPPNERGLAVADLDRDGHLDLVAAGLFSSDLGVYFGRGDGTFEPRFVIDPSAGADFIVVNDFDFDGWPDIFLNFLNNNFPGARYQYYKNMKNRSFAAAARYATGANAFQLAVADFNGDTAPDVAATAEAFGVAVLLNRSATDSDGDGVFDVIDCSPADPTVFAVPPEVSGVACDGDLVSWTSQATTAGSATTYDIARGTLPSGESPPLTCLASHLAATSLPDDTFPLFPDTAFWYEIRGRNACGIGTYGNQSDGTPRVIDACP